MRNEGGCGPITGTDAPKMGLVPIGCLTLALRLTLTPCVNANGINQYRPFKRQR